MCACPCVHAFVYVCAYMNGRGCTNTNTNTNIFIIEKWHKGAKITQLLRRYVVHIKAESRNDAFLPSNLRSQAI